MKLYVVLGSCDEGRHYHTIKAAKTREDAKALAELAERKCGMLTSVEETELFTQGETKLWWYCDSRGARPCLGRDQNRGRSMELTNIAPWVFVVGGVYVEAKSEREAMREAARKMDELKRRYGVSFCVRENGEIL